MSYDVSNRLHTITDSFGHTITLGYNSANQLVSATDPSARQVTYGFDASQRFSTLTTLDNTSSIPAVRTYVYENTVYLNQLTGMIDENGIRFNTWGYDTSGRGNFTQEAGNVGTTTLVYNTDGTVSTTDALNASRNFSFNQIGNQNRTTAISGSRCSTCNESASTSYDAAGFVSSRKDYNGNLTCYQNDPVRGLELYRVEGFAPGSTCPSSLSSYTPVAGTLQRKIATVWSASWREPTSITEPNRTTTFTNPDANGNFQTKKITETSVTPNVTRTWTYTFNSFGQVLTIDGPRTDVVDKTTYTYWNCSGYNCGQVETVTNASGHVMTFNTYAAYGQPLSVTDPNGVAYAFTYDKSERLASVTVGTGATAEETQYSYWPTGLLETVTVPDGSTIRYTYDGAHRLTTITDSLGNYIQYTLDAMGNPTETQSFDPSGTAHRTHYQTYTQLSQLYTDVLAANTSSVTTTFAYDAQGNLTNINAPLSRNTVGVPDALNRLTQITDPSNGVSKIGYDANDNIASVLDPRSFSTSYSHNGFNQVIKLVSPDTGTSLTTYDSGGNVNTTTDARSALATYSYDALNRETKVVYSDQTINYGYDSGTNGKGHLTSASDANPAIHTMAWTYDPQGRVNGKSQTVASVTKSVGYAYTNGDLITLTTSSGQTITYGYTNHRITSIKVGSTTLLSGVTYDPLGPVTGWTWGNNNVSTRSFDPDGNPSSIVTAGTTNTYTPDAASRITQITAGRCRATRGISPTTIILTELRPRAVRRKTVATPTMRTATAPDRAERPPIPLGKLCAGEHAS